MGNRKMSIDFFTQTQKDFAQISIRECTDYSIAMAAYNLVGYSLNIIEDTELAKIFASFVIEICRRLGALHSDIYIRILYFLTHIFTMELMKIQENSVVPPSASFEVIDEEEKAFWEMLEVKDWNCKADLKEMGINMKELSDLFSEKLTIEEKIRNLQQVFLLFKSSLQKNPLFCTFSTVLYMFTVIKMEEI